MKVTFYNKYKFNYPWPLDKMYPTCFKRNTKKHINKKK